MSGRGPNANARTHGHTRKGGPPSPTYCTWMRMMHRCRDASNPTYGGAGIGVCDRWVKFENFLADMGERPEGTSIDRIDNAAGYSPENCRWATAAVQSQNRSITKLNEVSVSLIRYMHKRGGATRDLAFAFGVSGSQIKRIVSREAWS